MNLARDRIRAALNRREQKHPPFTWGFGPNLRATEVLNDAFAAMGIDFA